MLLKFYHWQGQKLFLLFFLLSSTVFAADLHISGPTEVCPNTDYTYTASASNIFGARNGDFQWKFWHNNQVIAIIGYIDCDNNSQVSSSTVTFNSGMLTGAFKIEVRFHGRNDIGCGISTESRNVTVRVATPGPISGLLFCSPGETRTLSIPGIPNTAELCNFHHKYDWIVPAGWSVTPSNPSTGYIPITGGIRTFATSVSVTAPSTISQGGYNVIVRTEPAWPWTTQSTGEIWVGKPMIDGSYNGQLLRFLLPDEDIIPYNDVCNGYSTTCNMSFRGSSSGNWQKISSNPSSLSWSQSGNDLNFYFWAVGQTSSYRLTTSNVCGSTTNYYYFKSIDCSGGGGDPCNPSFSVSPNPSSNTVNIVVPNVPPPCESIIATSEQTEQTKEKRTIKSVTLHNADGVVKLSQEFTGKKESVSLDISDLPKGIYILKISDGTSTETHRIVKE